MYSEKLHSVMMLDSIDFAVAAIGCAGKIQRTYYFYSCHCLSGVFRCPLLSRKVNDTEIQSLSLKYSLISHKNGLKQKIPNYVHFQYLSRQNPNGVALFIMEKNNNKKLQKNSQYDKATIY